MENQYQLCNVTYVWPMFLLEPSWQEIFASCIDWSRNSICFPLLVLEFPGLLIPIHFLDCILAEIDKLSRSPMLLDTIYYIYLSHFALRMPKIYLLLAKWSRITHVFPVGLIRFTSSMLCDERDYVDLQLVTYFAGEYGKFGVKGIFLPLLPNRSQ